MPPRSACRFWIGPSGWSYPDWFGVVYPLPKPRNFKPLAFLAQFVNATEVNTSFYRIPTPQMTAAWPPLVPEHFRFAFKLHQGFTHAEEFPGAADIASFHAALAPIDAAGKLGPVLAQFPWSFRYTASSVDRLRRIADAFPTLDRFIEVRHSSWASPEALAALGECGGYCNIDQPALRECLPPSTHVFGRNAYVRLHGRNAANWFAEGLPAFERYNYLYSIRELREWVARLNAIRDRATETYVFANNHYRGQAVANALQIRALLTASRVAAPDALLETFPTLRKLATPAGQPGLFDALDHSGAP
jgi:uncharacterized protein YecE (DUF72 family)